VPLTGWRRFTRSFLLRAIAVLSAITFLLLCIEEHRRDLSGWDSALQDEWGPWHSFGLEVAGLPWLGAAMTFAAVVWARRQFPRGILAGALASFTAMGILMSWIAVHLFDDVQGDTLVVIALLQLPMFFLGLTLTVAEVALPVFERRRLEREDPVFPTARVVV